MIKAADRLELGRARLRITRLGLGTAPLGGLYEPVAERQAHATVERAWELGLRHFDAAPLYGYGLAEERLGYVLRRKPQDQAIVASKVGRLLRAGVPGEAEQRQLWHGVPSLGPVFDFSAEGVLRSFDESRNRLGLERIDLLHIHDPGAFFARALNESYPALERLRAEGSIRAVGVGMNEAPMLARFAREGDFDCFLLAGRYTLLDQTGLDELLPLCLERGIAIIVGGVYNSGILADPHGTSYFEYKRADEVQIQKVKMMQAVCRRHGVPLKAAAIKFPLGHPAVACVLTGCRSPEEVDENVRMFEWEIPPGLWDELRSLGLLGNDVPVPLPEPSR